MIRPLSSKVSAPPSGTAYKRNETFTRSRREQLALGGGPAPANPKSGNKSRITVTVRKKPLLDSERKRDEIDVLRVPSKKLVLIEEPRKDVTGAPIVSEHDFEFDRVYDHNCSNQQVYFSCVKTLVDAVFLEKAKCSCFAFGQTGSGKTYTMVGPGKGRTARDYGPEEQGLWEWAARDMTRYISEPEYKGFGLFVSFFEIYCNKVYDLLNERKQVKALDSKTAEGVVVRDLTSLLAADENELLTLMDRGLAARTVGKNSRNADSSRSHALLTIEVKHIEQLTLHGKMAFVDLAGSERGADTLQQGRATQQDGAGINKSLLALKECIRAMDQGLSHIPFRDSELTKVLRDMFMTDSGLTLMIATVSPSSSCCEQTLNTLRYADRVYRQRKFAKPCIAESDAEDDTAETGEAAQPHSTFDSNNDVGSGLDELESANASFSSSDDDAVTDFLEDNSSSKLNRSRALSTGQALAAELNRSRQMVSSPRGIKESKGARPARIKQSTHSGLSNMLPIPPVICEQSDEEADNQRSDSRRPSANPPSVPTRASLSRSAAPPASPRSRTRYNTDFSGDAPQDVPQAATYRVTTHGSRQASERTAMTVARRPATSSTGLKLNAMNKSTASISTLQATKLPAVRRNDAKPAGDRVKRQSSPVAVKEDVVPVASLLGSEEPYLTPASMSRRMLAASHPVLPRGPDSMSSHEPVSDGPADHLVAAAEDSESSSLCSQDETTDCIGRPKWHRPDGDFAMLTAPSLDGQAHSASPDVSRVIQEPVSSELMEYVRQVLPTVDPSSLLNKLEEEGDEEIKQKQHVLAGTAWEAYSRLLDQQHAHLRDSASLSLFHVKLSRELDTPEQSKQQAGRPSMSTAAKTVGINPEKIRLVRLIIEKQLAGLISLGHALVEAEAGLSNCRRLETEVKQRSMRSVQYYQTGGAADPAAVKPLAKDSRKKTKRSTERL